MACLLLVLDVSGVISSVAEMQRCSIVDYTKACAWPILLVCLRERDGNRAALCSLVLIERRFSIPGNTQLMPEGELDVPLRACHLMTLLPCT